jgi:hypothetical protein
LFSDIPDLDLQKRAGKNVAVRSQAEVVYASVAANRGMYPELFQKQVWRILVLVSILSPSIANRIKAAAVINVSRRKKVLNS